VRGGAEAQDAPQGGLGWDLPPLQILDKPDNRKLFLDRKRFYPDFEPILKGELYGPLRDPRLFNQAALDTEAGTLVWPNGADFDPATLHDWPQCKAAFIEMASRWEPLPA
jgi:hypothetical protein